VPVGIIFKGKHAQESNILTLADETAMLCWNFRHQSQMTWRNIREESRPQWKHSSL